MRSHLRRPSPASLIAALALFVALGSSAIAAKRYLITSTSQIKPSVLRSLRRLPGGGIVARVRSRNAVTTASTDPSHPTFTSDALSAASWSQAGLDLDQLVGEVEVSDPAEANCSFGSPGPFPKGAAGVLYVKLNGTVVGQMIEFVTASAKTVSRPIEWQAQPLLVKHGAEVFESFAGYPAQPFLTLWEPGATRRWTLSAEVADSCGLAGGNGGGHFTMRAIRVDVLAAR